MALQRRRRPKTAWQIADTVETELATEALRSQPAKLPTDSWDTAGYSGATDNGTMDIPPGIAVPVDLPENSVFLPNPLPLWADAHRREHPSLWAIPRSPISAAARCMSLLRSNPQAVCLLHRLAYSYI